MTLPKLRKCQTYHNALCSNLLSESIYRSGGLAEKVLSQADSKPSKQQ